jgi:hypothetical protein
MSHSIQLNLSRGKLNSILLDIVNLKNIFDSITLFFIKTKITDIEKNIFNHYKSRQMEKRKKSIY